MKRNYEKPTAEIVDLKFSEHIAEGSGDIPSGDCGWHWENFETALTGNCAQNYYGNAL